MNALCAGLLLAASLAVVPAARGMEAAPVEAAWQPVEVDFTYFGQTSFYTCDSLRRKVARILRELGARESFAVRATTCWSNQSVERVIAVRLRGDVPVPVDALEGLTDAERSRQELLARVRGQTDAGAVEASAPFAARWTRIELDGDSRFLEDGDCELVEQLARQVLPKLGVRIVENRVSCIPGQVRRGQINLTVDALRALPTPDDEP